MDDALPTQLLKNQLAMMAAIAAHRDTPPGPTTDLRLRIEESIRLLDRVPDHT
jgi:hypothetical protein